MTERLKVVIEIMGKDKSDADLNDILRKVQEAGYTVKRKGVYVKKTFDVDQELLAAVTEIRQRSKMTLREAMTRALELWVKHNQAKRGPRSSDE